MKFKPILFFVLWLCVATPAHANRTDDYVRTQMAKRHIPSVAVAVIAGGKVLLAREYGKSNLELSVPATSETVYEIGSLTKTFTAMAVVMLAEEGKLSLDDKITKHLPQLPRTYHAITIRQLLSHTGGLAKDAAPDYWQSQQLKRSDYSKDEFLTMLSKIPLSSQPGEKALYSNIGYFLLGLIVERVSGASYEKFLAERIFNPLGMKFTRVANRTDVIKNRAAGYSWDANGYANAEYIGLKHLYAVGGLVSSVRDLAKWEVALYTNRLVKKSTLDQMWTPTKLNDGKPAIIGSDASSGNAYNVSLSWFLGQYRGHKIIHHLGDLPGFSAQIIRFTEDQLTIIVLCNNGYGEDGRQNAELLAKGVADIHVPNLAEFTLREKAFNAYWENNYQEAAIDYAAAIEAGDKSQDNYYNAACAFSLNGDKDKAFGYLEEAIRLGFREVELLKVDKDLEPLRGDQRWQHILEMISAK